MSADIARLRALRREAGVATAAKVPAALPPPAMDTATLRRLLHRARPAQRAAPAPAATRALPGRELAPGLHLVAASRPAPPLPAHFDGAFDRRGAFAPQRVLCFDTETTGLAGGAGTRAFMIGAAAWHGATLELRQLCITRLGAERAMLAEFARWIAPDAILVSYNGKSFDAPLLRTRWRLAGLPDATAGLPHVDLLHAARRRWRGRWPDCRLATVEREVLGVAREDDLPGSAAPAAWLEYLRGGSAAPLRAVLAHNLQDVASLAGLLRHLGAAGAPAG